MCLDCFNPYKSFYSFTEYKLWYDDWQDFDILNKLSPHIWNVYHDFLIQSNQLKNQNVITYVIGEYVSL